MGRWGSRLFKCDEDLDMAFSMATELGVSDRYWKHSMSAMVHQSDILAPPEAKARYQTPEYAVELADVIIPYIRDKLDTDDLGDRLFAASKAQETDEDDPRQETKYRTIILGALIMRAGAKIKNEDLEHLRALMPQINCSLRRSMSGDHGFRPPGRAQFLAALDHYVPGVPRSFLEPSCGRIEADIGHRHLICMRCRVATYCDEECQHAEVESREHQKVCMCPERR
ncbi:uncharacterized protein N7515_000051 [Penicillium bovifimosum]|uniref:MYND-type domain-containing protein n=1 Tax=Penicillium bovifimosum TaxID=126998 RepID=A0A9W9HH59_9EURO|nr:uncharacterized protein N7515_000051 [Penicillium bovifimosum]KAJ5145487.1 hypothetical protein N7515_000051 [Penicillium bovifimosum]